MTLRVPRLGFRFRAFLAFRVGALAVHGQGKCITDGRYNHDEGTRAHITVGTVFLMT